MKIINKKNIIANLIIGGIFLSIILLITIFSQESIFKDFQRIFINNKGYLDIIKGLVNTLIISVSGLIIGIIIGLIIAVISFIKSENYIALIIKKIASIYVLIFRGTPITVQLLIIYYIVLAQINSNVIVIALISFGLNSGAYVSEILRGGINSISRGQQEAGRSLGLSYFQTMRKVIIPQGIKNAIPSIGNEFISLVKETSVVGFIGAVDLAAAFRKIANSTYVIDLSYLMLGFTYFILVLIITLGLKVLEKRLAKSDRH